MEGWEHLRLIFLGLALCCLLFIVGQQEERRVEAAAGIQAGEAVVTGARLYEENCRKCHGSRGEGIGQLGPVLAEKHFFTGRMAEVGWLLSIDEYVTATTAGGRMMATRPLYAGNGTTAVMPPWALDRGGPLRADEITAISRFIMNWRATALGTITLSVIDLPPKDLGDSATIKVGGEVFGKLCLSCHALLGLPGGNGGPTLAGIGVVAAGRIPGLSAAEYIRQSVLIPEAFVVEGYGEMTDSQGCGALLSEEQLEAVTAFLLYRN
jgi:mono/diheme cytochrome c family protein